MKLLVWLLGRDGKLLDSHLFFFDRYTQLADFHRQFRLLRLASKLLELARAHFDAAPGDDEPPAAELAIPVPRPPVRTDAFSKIRADHKKSRSGSQAPTYG